MLIEARHRLNQRTYPMGLPTEIAAEAEVR
jgi:hypothetical protein